MNSNSSGAPEGPVSKSQRKREARAVFELAQRLVELRPGQLDSIPLSDGQRRAVEAAQRITQRIARKRETQFVAKLLRDTDPEPIVQALERQAAPGRAEAARQHRVERWRDALIAQGDPLVHELCTTHPAADRQQLRQLVMKAKQEMEADKAPAAARQLFRVLREMDQIDQLPETAPES